MYSKDEEQITIYISIIINLFTDIAVILCLLVILNQVRVLNNIECQFIGSIIIFIKGLGSIMKLLTEAHENKKNE